jgi:hypothetical protein
MNYFPGLARGICNLSFRELTHSRIATYYFILKFNAKLIATSKYLEIEL